MRCWRDRNCRSIRNAYGAFITALFLLLLTACGNQASASAHYTLKKVSGSASFSPRDSAGDVVFDGKMWILGGFIPERSNEVWSSTDGVKWVQAPVPIWSPRNLPGAVSFRGKMWMMGGFGGDEVGFHNDVYSSADGLTWQQETISAPWAKRAAFGLVSKGGHLYLFGGFGPNGQHYNDVWESDDGVEWRLLQNAAPWQPRAMFGFALYGDHIYLIGGGEYDSSYVYNVKDNYNDVWRSSDGENWELVSPDAGFSPRRFHKAFVLEGQLFIAAGFDLDPLLFDDARNGILKSSLTAEQEALYTIANGRGFGNLNDFWRSADGVTWQRLDGTDSAFLPRHAPMVFVFDNCAYIVAGFGAELFNDSWRLGR